MSVSYAAVGSLENRITVALRALNGPDDMAWAGMLLGDRDALDMKGADAFRMIVVSADKLPSQADYNEAAGIAEMLEATVNKMREKMTPSDAAANQKDARAIAANVERTPLQDPIQVYWKALEEGTLGKLRDWVVGLTGTGRILVIAAACVSLPLGYALFRILWKRGKGE